jgi:hypothetical protein
MSEKSKNTIVPECLDGDPWIGIATGHDLANWGHEDEVKENQHWRQSERLKFFSLTFAYLKENNVPGDYLEFGCHTGRTFRMALTEARKRNLEKINFWAFDSFEGLPEAEIDHGVSNWKPNRLVTSLETFNGIVNNHGLYLDKIKAIKGYYDASLTAELQRQMLDQGVRASLVNVDCDLEESARPIFSFIEPFLQEGTVIYLDDYFAGYRGSPERGVSRVFHDFIENSKFKAIQYLQVGWASRSFILY